MDPTEITVENMAWLESVRFLVKKMMVALERHEDFG